MIQSYASNYRRLWDRHWWWRSRRVFVKRLVKRLTLPQGAKVLDIGCGDGLFFDELGKLGEVYGIEPDARLIREDNPHRDRIEVTPFGPDYQTDRRYDLITMLDVLEHIEDDRGTLQRVHELLTPGGYLVMTVPAMSWLWSMHDVVNQHFRRYSRKELRGKIGEQGLEIHDSGYTFGWTVGAMLARRAIAPANEHNEEAGEYAVRTPPGPINMTLYGLTRLEQTVTRPFGTPLGSSAYAVARRAA
ncbi:MAG: class I SAM-dependent methyltransferase [Phycisphaerales bacterium JB063]